MKTFSEDTLLADLIARFAYLNDNNATALRLYDKILTAYNKVKT